MDSPESDNSGATPVFPPFTKAERIQQLNDIDKSITQLLHSAGLALKTLSATQSPDEPSRRPSERKEAFEETCNSYLKTLQAVDVGLHRQIYGLEEAKIIPAEKVKKAQDAPSGLMPPGAQKPAASQEQLAGDSGLGKLDIGFLNSKSGRVGRDMEAELWEKARKFLEQLEETKNGTIQNELEDHDMDT